MVGDVFDKRFQHSLIVWNLAIFHIASHQVAEDSSEILMPGVGEETARICKHAHKTAQQTK